MHTYMVCECVCVSKLCQHASISWRRLYLNYFSFAGHTFLRKEERKKKVLTFLLPSLRDWRQRLLLENTSKSPITWSKACAFISMLWNNIWEVPMPGLTTVADITQEKPDIIHPNDLSLCDVPELVSKWSCSPTQPIQNCLNKKKKKGRVTKNDGKRIVDIKHQLGQLHSFCMRNTFANGTQMHFIHAKCTHRKVKRQHKVRWAVGTIRAVLTKQNCPSVTRCSRNSVHHPLVVTLKSTYINHHWHKSSILHLKTN